MSRIRVVNKSGKYSLRYVSEDIDGNTEKIGDEVEFVAKDVHKLLRLLEEALQGSSKPVLVINAGNIKILEG